MEEQKKIELLIDKIIAGQASPEEDKEVKQYFNKNQQSSAWDLRLMGEKADVRENLKRKIAQGLLQEKPVKSTLQRFLPAMKIAASILIVLIGAWYINKQTEISSENTLVMQDVIVPGRDKGALTLSSGERIDIESIASGEEFNQNGVLLRKNEAGELSYTFSKQPSKTANISSTPLKNTLTTPLGGRMTIVLADGTKVWLNSGSTLVFPDVFSEDTREVTIKGEAYFQVAKNKDQPFIVHTDKTQIKVLGTEFNVNAYVNEDKNITTLIEGSIELQAAKSNLRIVPGQQAVMNKSLDMKIETADLEAITAWKHNNFIFKNQNIKTIMKELARWYDVEVDYKGNMDNKFFDIYVSRKNSIEDILNVIELTESVHFKIEGRRVSVIE